MVVVDAVVVVEEVPVEVVCELELAVPKNWNWGLQFMPVESLISKA